MTSETINFEVKSAFGNELPTPVKVGPYDVSLFDNMNEIPTGQRLNDEQYVNAVNARIKSKARADETAKALKAAGIEKPDQNTPEVIKANMVKGMLKMFPALSEAQATALVDQQTAAAASL